ncbi:UxaA family hydrolase [Salmonella enterica]|nr:UxaA family hydrolase [Salmonella enterica]
MMYLHSAKHFWFSFPRGHRVFPASAGINRRTAACGGGDRIRPVTTETGTHFHGYAIVRYGISDRCLCRRCLSDGFHYRSGTPIGTQIMPVIKVMANDITWQKMSDNIDLCVSAFLTGSSSDSEESLRILEEVIHVVNGKMTKSGVFGFNDLAISRVCNYV